MTESFQRPRWAIPVAIIGALLLAIGLTIGVTLGSGGTNPITVTSTTTTMMVAPTPSASR